MLSFLIARDTMHQNQWLAVIEELGGHEGQLPIPNSFPQTEEAQGFGYVFVDPRVGPDAQPLTGRFADSPSIDGKGRHQVVAAQPLGDEPVLATPKPGGFAQTEQMTAASGVLGAIKHAITGEA